MNKIKEKFGGKGGGSSTFIKIGGIKDIKKAFDYIINMVIE